MEQKVFFTNKQGNKLCGILHTPQKFTEKCIILCHGITVDKDEDGVFVDLAHELVSRDFAILRFDFRGHGESEGKSIDMTPMGETQDIDAAVEFLKIQGFEKFGIVGASFGGGVTVLFASQHPTLFSAIVLVNPLLDYTNLLSPDKELTSAQKYWGEKAVKQIEENGSTPVGSRGFVVGKDFLRELQYLKPWQGLDYISCPILFVHGTEDSYIPYSDSVKFSKMFDLEMVSVEGGTHGFHKNYKHEEEANRATVDFFLKNL